MYVVEIIIFYALNVADVISKVLPVKNMGLKHLKKEKKMKNQYMVNTDKYMPKKLWQ